jgi:hypothetical protein
VIHFQALELAGGWRTLLLRFFLPSPRLRLRMLGLKRRSSAAPCTCNRRLTEFPPAHPFAKTAKGLGTLGDECHILRPERVRRPPSAGSGRHTRTEWSAPKPPPKRSLDGAPSGVSQGFRPGHPPTRWRCSVSSTWKPVSRDRSAIFLPTHPDFHDGLLGDFRPRTINRIDKATRLTTQRTAAIWRTM